MKGIVFLFLFIFLYAEPSAYSNDSRYLSPTDKKILANKKAVISLNRRYLRLKMKVSDLSDKLDGIVRSMGSITNLNQDIITLKKSTTNRFDSLEEEISILKEQNKKLSKKNDFLNAQLLAVQKNQKDIVNIQNQNYNNITNLIEKLALEVTKLKQETIVLKSKINKLEKDKQQLQTRLKETTTLEKIKKANKVDVFNYAIKLFNKDRLTDAKLRFKYLVNIRYKPATSSFYLGEIAFLKKNYKQALYYYKRSIEFYPKITDFTPKLLLHTGMSYAKLRDTKNAKVAFEKLIKIFPSKKEAKIAKKELKKL